MDQEAEKGILLDLGSRCSLRGRCGALGSGVCRMPCVPLLEGVCCQPDVLLVLLLCGDKALAYF